MRSRSVCPWMVLAVIACSLCVRAHSPPPPPPPDWTEDDADFDAAMDDHNDAQAALFDRLRADSSPRQQVLAGHLYFDDDDGTPTALRPKREEVVARAVRLAPDDVFVQWEGATLGDYSSSFCGPKAWPDLEVSNLTRLEPDNAAAWQFAVALAGAKGNQAEVDAALSHMAAAPRADDHFIEYLDEWKKALTGQPDAKISMPKTWNAASPEVRTLFHALQQTRFGYSSAGSAFAETCKPDATSDRTWQRLGWCADAARTLASKGSSVALRQQGFELLAAIGETSDATAEWERQTDWLDAHSANPTRNYEAYSDPPEEIAADWRGAKSEIAATERRMRRIGQPLEAPAGWRKNAALGERLDSDVTTAVTEYFRYLKSLADAMRISKDPHQQALAAVSAATLPTMPHDDVETADPTAPVASSTVNADSIARIAAAHSDDLLVQWVAATASDTRFDTEARAAAIKNVERLDDGNAAALALSLAGSADDSARTGTILRRMAASGRYDDYASEILGVWLDAVKQTPPPAAIGDPFHQGDRGGASTAGSDDAANAIAMMMAQMTSTRFRATIDSCTTEDSADAVARRTDCIAIGRLQLYSAKSLVGAQFGQMLLLDLDAAAAADLARMRELAWWSDRSMSSASNRGPELARYLDDVRAHGEVEAARLAAVRAGKADPPANWKSPAEKNVARKLRKTR